MDRQMVFGLMPYSSNSSGESWEWGWVDCEVLYICYIGKQGEEFQIVHKPPVFLLATLNLKGEYAGSSIGEILRVQCVVRMSRQAGMINFFHLRIIVQIVHHFLCIFCVTFQA